MEARANVSGETEAGQQDAPAVTRLAGLVRAWADGLKLGPVELTALRALLPVHLVDNQPLPQPRYRENYESYASAVQRDVRTIKRWVAVGRAARELPPYDAPAGMLAWWNRMKAIGAMQLSPPDGVVVWAQRSAHPVPSVSAPAGIDASTAPAAAIAGAPAPTGANSPPASSSAIGYSQEVTATTLDASVAKLRLTLARNQDRLDRAMMANPLDEGLVTSCQRNVEKCLDLLRVAEKDLYERRKQRGELVPLVEVREDWSTLLASVRQMRLRSTDNICAALAAAFTPEQLAAVRSAIVAEREREEKLLRGARHWRAAPDVPPVANSV